MPSSAPPSRIPETTKTAPQTEETLGEMSEETLGEMSEETISPADAYRHHEKNLLYQAVTTLVARAAYRRLHDIFTPLDAIA